MLSRFTRPLLLSWPASEVCTLFGEDVHRRFAHAAESVHLEFAGVVARPLYKCTEPGSSGEFCMNVASMSQFLQMSASRPAYKCKECSAKARGAQVAPGSASAGRRCLWASPTVAGADGQPTPLRVPAVARLLAHAPPDTWGWCQRPRLPPHAPAASPQALLLAKKKWYNYTAEESARIWSASDCFQGSSPLVE